MENIFKDAYFGKAYKTRDGRKAIYWNYTEGGHHELIFDTGTWMCYNDDGRYSKTIEEKIDIVSEWNEEINEEELTLLTIKDINEMALKGKEVTPTELWKAGYRKAKGL